MVNRENIIISLDETLRRLNPAIVIKITRSYYFLKKYEVLEIIAKPYYPRIKLQNIRTPRGNDLKQYYERKYFMLTLTKYWIR